MVIKLDDKSLEELEKEAKPSFEPIPEDTICDFEVLREGKAYGKDVYTEEKMSKTEKDMLVAVLRVFYGEQKRTLVVYLTDGDSNYEKWRNKSFAACLGVNSLDAETVIGATGRCKIGVEEREYNGKITSNNIVKEFIPQGVEVELDDEIPTFN